jgi:hypothetical protein
MTQDPRRLTDDHPSSELARALCEAQGKVLSPEAVSRVRAALSASGIAVLGEGPVHATPPAPQTPGSAALKPLSWAAKGFTATSLKVGLAALGVALLAGSAWKLGAPRREGPPPVTAKAVVSAPTSPAGEAAQPVPSTPTRPSFTTQPSVIEAAPPAAPSAPPAGAPLRTAESATAKASAGQPNVPSPREGTLLLQARRMLDTDPVQALVLVQVHEKEFPRSQLALERARIAAEARRRSGL